MYFHERKGISYSFLRRESDEIGYTFEKKKSTNKNCSHNIRGISMKIYNLGGHYTTKIVVKLYN